MPAHPGPSQKKSLPRITQAKVQSHSCCNSVAIVGACGQTQTVRDLLAEGDGRSPPSDQCFCLGRPAPPLGYTENRASTGFVAIYRIYGHLPDLWRLWLGVTEIRHHRQATDCLHLHYCWFVCTPAQKYVFNESLWWPMVLTLYTPGRCRRGTYLSELAYGLNG